MATRLVAGAAACVLLGMGCAGPMPEPAIAAPANDSPISGTIGAAARAEAKRIVISAVGEPAKSAGLEVGDVVLAYDGVKVGDLHQFERLVLDSPPGSRVTLQVLRDGALRVVDIRVRQIPTGNRA